MSKQGSRSARSRKRLAFLAAAAAATPLVNLPAAQPAGAYALRPCKNGILHWSYGTDNTVDIPVDTGAVASNYLNTALLAIDSWQSYSGSPFEYNESSYATLKMFSADGGENGVSGISTAECTLSGLFTSGTVGLNTHYGDKHTGGRRQSTWAHEIGHSVGLKHFGALNCADLPVMSDNGDVRYDICGKKTPQADDRNGISAIY